jgi:hypothetical protein
MSTQYKSHDDATLSYLEEALCYCPTFKDDILLGRAGKRVKAKATALMMAHVKK